jgi:hypothetical protein
MFGVGVGKVRHTLVTSDKEQIVTRGWVGNGLKRTNRKITDRTRWQASVQTGVIG